MKRFKIIAVAFIVLLLCAATSGCAQSGSVVPNSLDYTFHVYNSLQEVSVNYSFDVTMPASVNYEVKYTLNIYNGNSLLGTQTKTKTISPNKEGKYTVSEYMDCDDYYVAGISESSLRLRITDIAVTPKSSDNKYQSYAIGFGTAGAAVLIACTVLFIVFKVKEKKED